MQEIAFPRVKYFKISWGRTPRPPKTYCLLPKHAYYTKSSRYAPDNLTCFLNRHYIVQFKSKFVLFGLVHILNIGTLPKRTLATGLSCRLILRRPGILQTHPKCTDTSRRTLYTPCLLQFEPMLEQSVRAIRFLLYPCQHHLLVIS